MSQSYPVQIHLQPTSEGLRCWCCYSGVGENFPKLSRWEPQIFAKWSKSLGVFMEKLWSFRSNVLSGGSGSQLGQSALARSLLLARFMPSLRFHNIWGIKRSGKIPQVPDHIPELSFHLITGGGAFLKAFLKGSLESKSLSFMRFCSHRLPQKTLKTAICLALHISVKQTTQRWNSMSFSCVRYSEHGMVHSMGLVSSSAE